MITGVTAEKFAPYDEAAEGANIKIVPAESLYARLEQLVENSRIVIILPGDTGTELEVLAGLHFGQKLKGQYRVGLPAKLIFVGTTFLDIIQNKFPKLLTDNETIFLVGNSEQAIDLVEVIFQNSRLENQTTQPEKMTDLQTGTESKLMKPQLSAESVAA